MIKNRYTAIIVTAFLLVTNLVSAQNIRGFYLQDFDNWLGSTTEENKILQYIQGNGFNYILFYDLGQINWNSSSEKDKLGAFMHKARTQYGVLQFGAVVEYSGYVTQKILPYNNGRTRATEKFDVIDLEFEFWVKSSISGSYCSKFLNAAGYSCDTAGAWKFAWREFKIIDDLCANNGMISEFYIGWPNKGQLQQIASRADRILLSAYRPTDSDIYLYSKNRMNDISSIGGTTKILTLLSSESSFMGPWLNTHPQTRPYQTMKTALANETASFKNHIDLDGYQWFTYKYMPKTTLATASISANGPLTFCPGGSVTLTANSGTSYQWSPGGQTTQSITVTSGGTYTVTVASSGGATAVSSPVVVSTSGTGQTPTVSASGATSFCPGGSVTLTASSASSYQWSTGATSQSITVTSSGSYTVTTGSGSCTATSAPISVNASAMPATPTISASGSLSLCAGSVLVLTSSSANGYLWSNGATTRSIAVSGSGNYSVNAYSGPNCYATSATKTVTTLAAPAKPVITYKSTTSLNGTGSSVKLISSAASAYQWTNGSSSRIINVTSQGNYRVTITGSNGCKSTSDDVFVSANGCTPPPTPTITYSGSSIITSGQSITLTSSSSSGYLWSNGDQTRSITVTTPGTYTVRAYSHGGCYSTSLPVEVTVLQARISTPPAEAGDNTTEQKLNEVNVFPNPARDHLTISFTASGEKTLSIKILDMSGREVVSKEFTPTIGLNNIELDMASLTRGIYFTCLQNGEERQMLKVVLE